MNNSERAFYALRGLQEFVRQVEDRTLRNDDPEREDYAKDLIINLLHYLHIEFDRTSDEIDAMLTAIKVSYEAELLEEEDEAEVEESERDDEGRTAQDRYDDDCIEQYGCVEIDNSLNY
jgi:hypothetical protein